MVKKREWKPGPRDLEMLEHLGIAGQQLDDENAEPGGRLGWIVRFAREDPKRWLPADREARGYRLLAFAGFGGGSARGKWLAPNVQPLRPSEIMAAHSELRDTLKALVSVPVGQPVPIPSEELHTSLVRATEPGAKPAIFGYSRGGPFRTMLWQAVAKLVSDTDRLIACRYCGEPFLALRKKYFCTPACTQRWHDREKKARPKQASGAAR